MGTHVPRSRQFVGGGARPVGRGGRDHADPCRGRGRCPSRPARGTGRRRKPISRHRSWWIASRWQWRHRWQAVTARHLRMVPLTADEAAPTRRCRASRRSRRRRVRGRPRGFPGFRASFAGRRRLCRPSGPHPNRVTRPLAPTAWWQVRSPPRCARACGRRHRRTRSQSSRRPCNLMCGPGCVPMICRSRPQHRLRVVRPPLMQAVPWRYRDSTRCCVPGCGPTT